MKLSTRKGFAFGTNINNVVVPAALRVKIKTGRDFIDGAMGGLGLTPSTCTLFTGTPGAGKSTMMLELCESLSSLGHNVAFNTAEESLFQVKLVAERLNIKHGFAVGEEEMVPELLRQCEELRLQHPKKQFILVVDSLQAVNDGKYGPGVTNGKSPERCLGMITDWCKETNSIAFVIGQVGKDGKFSGKNVLKHMVDAMIELSIEMNPSSELYGMRMLETTKNRFGGAGHKYFLELKKTGFKTLLRVAA